VKPFRSLISVAKKGRAADLVLKGGQVFNVFTGDFVTSDVAIVEGYIAGVGQYSGREELDLRGKYVTPGFIDGHVHIESSMVSPAEFARAVVPSGTTTVVADPHEIANVAGLDGIRYMLAASAGLPLRVYVMLPSCVPASPLEHSGAVLGASDLAELMHHPRVLGLGELMNYPGTLAQDEDVLAKIDLALAAGKLIDGHAPGLGGSQLMAYAAAGIRSDHECTTPEEARERLAAGMHVMLREGSAAQNLADLLPAVDAYTARHCLLATDDRHPGDLIALGSINHLVKKAVEAGTALPLVLQMATLNAASYFGLDDLGAIAPGFAADVLVFDDLKSWRPSLVIKAGRIVAEDGKPLFAGREAHDAAADARVRNTVRLKPIDPAQLKIPARSGKARVIGLVPHQIVTRKLILDVPAANGEFMPDPAAGILKLAVFERHNHTGHAAAGLVHGLGLTSGAIASTVAHDSHNLIVIGANDADMLLAAREIERMQGGIAIVKNGRVLKSFPLPLAGLMSDQDIYTVETELAGLRSIARQLGVKPEYDPIFTLAFLSLPVIPALKLTDMGLIDAETFSLVPVSL